MLLTSASLARNAPSTSTPSTKTRTRLWELSRRRKSENHAGLDRQESAMTARSRLCGYFMRNEVNSKAS
jgi:hypothetical protein